MKPDSLIRVLLLDIGGILLTDGWETNSRARAAAHFSLDLTELNQRHANVFDAYESGKMDLEEYLKLVVFYQERSFSINEFKDFMMSQSQPHPEMLQLMADFRQQYKVPVLTVSNEPKELNEYRIKTFGLTQIIDFFVSSCYVNVRKPDKKIYEMALNMAQVKPHEALYIDDRKVYIEFAAQLGINTIHHKDAATTQSELKSYGFDVQQSVLSHQNIS
ncbi:HAD-IA family hydrolase [Mucilaginibacter sp.]